MTPRVLSAPTSGHATVPILETERLILRAPRVDDARTIATLANDARIAERTARIPHPYTISDALAWIEAVAAGSREQAFVIALSDGPVIGACGLHDGAEGVPDIGYWLGVPYWGKGLIPEAVREVMRHAFETLKLKTLWCGYFADNTQSYAAQSKCGFRHHHTEENKYNPFLQDYRTEHISCITYQAWLEHTQDRALFAEAGLLNTRNRGNVDRS